MSICHTTMLFSCSLSSCVTDGTQTIKNDSQLFTLNQWNFKSPMEIQLFRLYCMYGFYPKMIFSLPFSIFNTEPVNLSREKRHGRDKNLWRTPRQDARSFVTIINPIHMIFFCYYHASWTRAFPRWEGQGDPSPWVIIPLFVCPPHLESLDRNPSPQKNCPSPLNNDLGKPLWTGHMDGTQTRKNDGQTCTDSVQNLSIFFRFGLSDWWQCSWPINLANDLDYFWKIH